MNQPEDIEQVKQKVLQSTAVETGLSSYKRQDSKLGKVQVDKTQQHKIQLSKEEFIMQLSTRKVSDIGLINKNKISIKVASV